MQVTDRCPTCHRKIRRSNQANARYWLLLHTVAERLHPSDVTYSPEVWHAYFKSRFLGCDDLKLPNGRLLVVPLSSASLDTAEFSDYMTQVELWAGERGIWLDDIEGAA